MKKLFRRIFSYGCRKSWYAGEWSKPVLMAKSAPTAATTALRRLSFAENVVVQAINTLLGDTSTYQAQLQQNIAKVIRSAQQKTADSIDERLQELQKELLKKANNKEDYDEIADEIFKLREQREKCTVDTAATYARTPLDHDGREVIFYSVVYL